MQRVLTVVAIFAVAGVFVLTAAPTPAHARRRSPPCPSPDFPPSSFVCPEGTVVSFWVDDELGNCHVRCVDPE